LPRLKRAHTNYNYFFPRGHENTTVPNNLAKFDHIVVLMLENRSFDHMLGYLSLPENLGGRARSDVDGLKGDEVNSLNGDEYPVFHLNFDSQSENTKRVKEIWSDGEWKPRIQEWSNERAFRYKEPTSELKSASDSEKKWKVIDPCHFCVCVLQQIEHGAGGYVRNFHKAYEDIYPGIVMGYYNHEELPIYDLLAEEFLICDRWFSSMPGPTVPNRAYSFCGTTHGNVIQPVHEETEQEGQRPAFMDMHRYTRIPTVFERLEENDIEWAYYYRDTPFLALWRRYHRLWMREKRGGKSPFAKVDEFKARLKEAKSKDDFPAVSWVDPNFVQVGSAMTSNDDHSPSDVHLGQEGVHEIVQAVLESELSDRILLIITYDEHGGFYDHVNPKDEPVHDDFESMEQRGYGVRVPTFIVSPHVKERGVSHDVFDHTSVLKTILMKYCGLEEGDEQADWMSKRVKHATGVASLLTEGHDAATYAARKTKLFAELEEMREGFVSYRKALEDQINDEQANQDDELEHEPTHLQHLLMRAEESPWHLLREE